MTQFIPLETVVSRAPLAIRFLDLARGSAVTDGLVVTAWRVGEPGRTGAPSLVRGPDGGDAGG